MKTGEKQTEQVNYNQHSQAANIICKEALVKASKYAAFTAVGMMVLLSTKKSQAQSSEPLGGNPWG